MAFKSFVVSAALACGFAADGFAGSNTKNVLNFKKDSGTVHFGGPLLTTKDSYTYSAWVKLDKEGMSNYDSRYPYGPLFAQTGNAADNVFAYLRGQDQMIFMRSQAWSPSDDMKTIVSAPPSGEWHFLTAVYDRDAKTRSIYFDAKLIAEDADARDYVPSKSDYIFGYIQWGNHFRGQMAEASLWQKALTVDEISSIMTARPVGDALDKCIGYWPMDEGDGGATVVDITPNGNNLTITATGSAVLESTDDFPDFRVVSPRFAVTHTLAYDSTENVVTVTATPTEPPSGTDLKVVVTAPNGTAETNTLATAVVDGQNYQTVLTGLERDTAYEVAVLAEDAFADVTSSKRTAYTGAISIEPAKSTVTGYGEDGVFVISRGEGDAATAYDLVVRYEISGTAENGVDYKTLTGTVVIPAGASSAEVVVSQLADCPHADDLTVVLTLATDGDYAIGVKSEAEITKRFYSGNHEKKVLNVKGNLATSISAGAPVVIGNGSFTLAVWAKLDKENMPLTDSRYPCGPMMSQNYHFCYERGKDNIVFDHGGASRATAPYSGEWHFLAAVFDKDATQRRIYVDGFLKTEEDDKSTGSQSANFAFGYLAWGNYFRGSLTEMSVWNKALSVEEIKAIMWTRPDVFTDCAGYWPLDEGDGGTTARDISGNGKTLTLGDAATHALETATDFVDFEVGDSRIKYDAVLQYPQELVSVKISGTEMVGGKFVAGSEATFVASCPGYKFVGWFGDVEESQSHNETITLTMDATKVLVPIYEFDWVYDQETKTISDGYWVLNVTEKNAELTLTGIAATTVRNTSGQPAAPLLDLRKGLTEPYSIVTIAAKAFIQTTSLKIVRLPDTLRRMEGNWGNTSGAVGPFWSCANLETVEPFLPQGLEFLGSYTFQGCGNLGGDLVLGADEGEFAFSLAAYHRHYFNGTAIASATLRKNVSMIPFNTFDSCAKLETVVCEGVISNIEAKAFSNCKSLREFTLKERPETIESTAFSGWTTYQCRFLVNTQDPGWAAYMADSANFTPWGSLDQTAKDKYTAAFPGVKKPIGLSKTLPANQWLCNLKEPGMKLIFR